MKVGLVAIGVTMSALALTLGGRVMIPLAAQSPGAPTFNKDVAPIIFSSCVRCHRPNQVGTDVVDVVQGSTSLGTGY